ncbi:hypothetical protein FACS1894145_4920 [Bacteroidia bacterium]|nr:hypothetical protein FACS1894145_4920 [Bacteroidia bacterium]
MKNKTVFDVNIWISYFIKAKTEQIVDMIENNNVFFYRSSELLSELKAVINRPKFSKYFPFGTQQFITFFEMATEFFNAEPLFISCADPKDNYLFDLALQTNSKYLVSGDKKVLETQVDKPLNVLSLTDFKKKIYNLPKE